MNASALALEFRDDLNESKDLRDADRHQTAAGWARYASGAFTTYSHSHDIELDGLGERQPSDRS